MLKAVLLGALALAIASPALAAPHCIDVAIPKKQVADLGGQWIELTQEQWQFLRGVSAVNPETPPGLPSGNKAILVRPPEGKGGMIIFIDGDKACAPMSAPQELLDMLNEVGEGKIAHEGSGS